MSIRSNCPLWCRLIYRVRNVHRLIPDKFFTDFLTVNWHIDINNAAKDHKSNTHYHIQLQYKTLLRPHERCECAHFAPAVCPCRSIFCIIIVLQMNIIVFTMRQNARCFKAQHKYQQIRYIAHHEQGHLHTILKRCEFEPPIILFHIDECQVLANEC